MADSMLGVVIICVHLIICAVVYVCMRFRLLKVRTQMMPVVVCIPLWGILCVILMHIMHEARLEGTSEAGVEKLQANEEEYRSLLVEDLNMQRSVVPLQEALILNDARMRRGMMLDVLYENPDDYFELLDEARDNEDGEIVHYATTAMAELAKDYDFRLQQLERAYMDHPLDTRVLRAYCDFLGQYLERGFVSGQMELVQRRQYAQLLAQSVLMNPNIADYAKLASTQMKIDDFVMAAATLDEMERRWPNEEQTLLVRLEYAVRQKNSEMVAAVVEHTKSSEVYLSTHSKKQLRFFEEEKSGAAERTQAI